MGYLAQAIRTAGLSDPYNGLHTGGTVGGPVLSVADHYLEAIYTLRREGEDAFAVTLADLFSVSRANAGATLGRLTRDGLVRTDGRHILLTAEGRLRAEAGLRRHLITECFLLDVLGMDWAVVHTQARSFESGLTTLLEERIDQRLEYPRVCPHGTPIPRPEQAERTESATSLAGAPIDMPLSVAWISELVEYSPKLLRFCAEHGVRPGTPVRLAGRVGPTASVVIDRETLEVGPELLTRIWVRPL
jgi:DtxR family transcriptional regulator, Mn-dependent transcriptional regulator